MCVCVCVWGGGRGEGGGVWKFPGATHDLNIPCGENLGESFMNTSSIIMIILNPFLLIYCKSLNCYIVSVINTLNVRGKYYFL